MANDEVLAHLIEMFGDSLGQQRIQDAAAHCGHDLVACIEMLLLNDNDKQVIPEQPKTTTESVTVEACPPMVSKGAIKKSLPPKPSADASFASFFENGSASQGFTSIVQPQPPMENKRDTPKGKQLPSNFNNLVQLINQGYRVMVLMRGAPGSGKSTLSRALIDQTLGNSDYRNHIFSADEYFMVNGIYKYQPDRIEDAHRFNQKNVLAKARDGWSPIVVDNTNIKLWEMECYVRMAVENGYYVDVLEPVTHWRHSARALAARNIHSVPEMIIKRMLLNYDKLNDVKLLYKEFRLEHALYLPPKMRHFPIIKEDLLPANDAYSTDLQPQERKTASEITAPASEWESISWDAPSEALPKVPDQLPSNDSFKLATDIPVPKPPRSTPKRMYVANVASNNETANQILPMEEETSSDWNWPAANENSWKPYDEESVDFWISSNPAGQKQQPVVVESPQPKRPEQSVDLLSTITIPAEWRTPEADRGDTEVKSERKKTDGRDMINLVRHRRGCKNENTNFSEICNLYPQIPAQYLWDLFEKCNGDADWTANLLLEEQKSYDFAGQREDNVDTTTSAAECGKVEFDCDCNEPLQLGLQAPSGFSAGGYETDRSNVSSGSPRNTLRRKHKGLSEDLQQTKKQIESFVVLGKQHYSNHIQQIRVAKGIIAREEIKPPAEEPEVSSSDEPVVKTEAPPEVLEVTLGVDLIKQLHELFKDKHGTQSFSLDNLTPDRTKVFMATEMAEQLYLSFVDSVYSQSEEEKLSTIQKDAQIAKQLDTKERYPALFSDKPPSSDDGPNLTDIIEMEYALSAYRNEVNGWTKQIPQDLASQMTRQKLVEMYPSVDETVLSEILHAHNNRFEDTVKVLNNSIPTQLRHQIAREREALLKRAETGEQIQPSVPTESVDQTSSVSGEDAINIHLKTAEECRNLAQHHQELKNECHEKARSAIQRGMAGVAEYYAQIARLHRTKIDMYNSKASNAIMEVHKLTLNNDDVLDLHYLHSEEALRCLEIFLAEHAGKLRTRQQPFKKLFIITGRGLHSADGIPIIKHRVKTMLRDLGLRYVELNPGFLRLTLKNTSDTLDRLLVGQS